MFEAISELDQPTYTTVRLVSSDGKSFLLPKEVAFLSEFVHTYLTGEFREAAGPAGVITQRGMGDLPRTVHVDIPGKELNVLVQMMRLLHEHQGSAKAQANAVARMPRVKSDNVGALIDGARFLQLPASCAIGLIDHLAEFINQQKTGAETGLFNRLANYLYGQTGTSEDVKIPFDDRNLLTQLGRTYFLKYDQELELADGKGNPIDIGGFSIQELLDAGRKIRMSRLSGLRGILMKSVFLKDVLTCDLDNMRINSLEGLSEIPEIALCRKIALSNNQIATIQLGTFQELPNLLMLHLHNNQITKISSDTFQGLKNLRWLRMHKNKINSVEADAFRGLPNLIQLILANNQIDSISPEMFREIPKLQALLLADNNITSIQSGIFQELPHLTMLDLGSNKIASIQPKAFQGVPLRKVNLQNNKLSANAVGMIRQTLPAGCRFYAQNQRWEIPAEWREQLAEAVERRRAPPAA